MGLVFGRIGRARAVRRVRASLYFGITRVNLALKHSRAKPAVEVKMQRMAKKTEMSDSSLWIVVIVLLALSAWMYFKR